MTTILPASFRDPSGFVFRSRGDLLRQVNRRYSRDYDRLISSGLYDELVAEGLLVKHTEQPVEFPVPAEGYKVIRPERVPFISYPYEWCFGQLKDAALALLRIQRAALERGMTLKDATAFNMQFHRGRPVLIDTLSFEEYREGDPWVAYRQFCEHFYAPLALMAMTDVRLASLSQVFIDGVPLDLANRLLPLSSRLRPSTLVHVVLHAKMQSRYAGRATKVTHRPVRRASLLGLIDSLESAISRLSWTRANTEWGEYYSKTNYSEASLGSKSEILRSMICDLETRPSLVIDLGANTGVFSRVAAEYADCVVCSDIDPAAVEQNYREVRRSREQNLLPLVLNLCNPSPDVGWANAERESFVNRGPADLVIALALIHHLVIRNNVPLDRVSRLLGRLARHLIIEFVPKHDSQVARLLANREDIFPDYCIDRFEEAFEQDFEILRAAPIAETGRTMYLMRSRGHAQGTADVAPEQARRGTWCRTERGT